MLPPIEKGISLLRIEKNLAGLAVRFFQQRMIRLMCFQDAKNCFRAPMHLPACALLTRVIARYHQTGLGDSTELPFHQLRTTQSQAEVFFRAFAFEAEPPVFQRKFLELSQRKQETRVIDGDKRISAAPILHPTGYDARQGIVGAAADEGMEKIMGEFVTPVQFN